MRKERKKEGSDYGTRSGKEMGEIEKLTQERRKE